MPRMPAVHRRASIAHGGSAVHFPASQHLAPAIRFEPLEPALNISDMRVLVVEDDADSAEMMRLLLVGCGYHVTVAGTSQEGIAAARRVEPHIVLCDIGLPDSDGYGVGSVLRQSGCTRTARLIAVTAHGETKDRLRALAAGFDEHLVKPVDPSVLLRQLHVTH